MHCSWVFDYLSSVLLYWTLERYFWRILRDSPDVLLHENIPDFVPCIRWPSLCLSTWYHELPIIKKHTITHASNPTLLPQLSNYKHLQNWFPLPSVDLSDKGQQNILGETNKEEHRHIYKVSEHRDIFPSSTRRNNCLSSSSLVLAIQPMSSSTGKGRLANLSVSTSNITVLVYGCHVCWGINRLYKSTLKTLPAFWN